MQKLLLSTAFFAATSVPVMAQDADSMFRADADPAEIHASDFIGMRIYRAEGVESDAFEGLQDNWDDIGEVNDIILSRDGAVEAVLIDIGGFLGIGENQVAVDMDSLRFVSDDATTDDENDFFIVLNANRELLEQAPTYRGVRTDMDASTDMESDTASDTETTTETDMATNTDSTDADASDSTDTAALDSTDRVPVVREGYLTAERTDLTADELTGTRAYDSNDEWIGEVSEILLSEDGTIKSVVVDVGGFLGIGEKPVELSMDDIDILRAEDGSETRVYVSMSESELEAMPDYEG